LRKRGSPLVKILESIQELLKSIGAMHQHHIVNALFGMQNSCLLIVHIFTLRFLVDFQDGVVDIFGFLPIVGVVVAGAGTALCTFQISRKYIFNQQIQ
jgi:hypothetical protein